MRYPSRFALVAAAVLVALLVTVAFSVQPSPAGGVGRPRHLGYGISVGPHLAVSPSLLPGMGFDWVMVYDTAQLQKFPGVRVLYRSDVRGYPSNIASWEKDLHNLARQLRAQGVSAVAIGNEPNLSAEWGNTYPDPAHYADALCRAYRVFKEEAPEIVIVSAGLAPTVTSNRSMDDFGFAQKMLDAGAKDCFDAFGYHPYGFNSEPEAAPSKRELNFRRAELMHKLLMDNGIRDRQMWITEFGWVRNPAEDGLNCANEMGFRDFQWMIVSRNTQADYTVRAFQFAETNWPWVGPMFAWNLNWHQYDADYEARCSNLRFFSFLDSNGAPLPVFNAFKAMPKRPATYTPVVGAEIENMTRVVEAGCAGVIDMGSFTVVNAGYPGSLNVVVEPANGPGLPLVATSVQAVSSGDKVDVLVDTRKIQPGLYLIPINLRSVGEKRITSTVVRGWLLLNPPETPECVARFNNGE